MMVSSGSLSSEQVHLLFPKVASAEAKDNAARLQSAFLLASLVSTFPRPAVKAAAETTIRTMIAECSPNLKGLHVDYINIVDLYI